MLTILAIEVALAIFLILHRSYEIMGALEDIKASADATNAALADFRSTVDAFIKSDADNFQALKDAIGQNDPAKVAEILAAMEATRTALASAKDAVTAADAADNL